MELHWLLAPPLPEATPRQQVLYQRLRQAILSGRLAPDIRLPSSRTLAMSLGIARNTVLFAFEQLIAEGCLIADRQGTRVARLPVPSRTAGQEEAPDGHPSLSLRARRALEIEPLRESEALPFAPGMPDFAAFPFRLWRQCLERAWRDASWRQLAYSVPGGDPKLREALAGHLSSARGLPVTPQQIVITSGTQTALDLCARLFADHDDIAWVENPGYLSARTAFGLAGLRIRDIPVDSEGMSPSDEDWRAHSPRLIMVTPSHQYPTGRVMSLARRLELVDQARKAGTWVIEDDYDGEFRRAGPAPPALFGLQPDAPVIHVGTFSKTLYPGLRLGYMVVPKSVATDFASASAQATRAGQGIEQRALADFIMRGHYVAHLRRMRARYGVRLAKLRTALRDVLGADITLSGAEAGLHLVLWLPPETCATKAAERAATLGLGVRTLQSYATDPVRCNGLVLGYGNLDEGMISEGARRLSAALRGQ